MLIRTSYVVGEQFKTYDFPKSSKLVKLSGNKIDVDTLLSVVERSVSSDFTEYYDNFDKSNGVNYLSPIEQSSLEFDFGTLRYINSKVSKKFTTKKDFYCIRYICDDKIRSVISPILTDKKPDNFGISLIEYSSALSINSWIRLKTLYNIMVGFEALSLNVTKRELKFQFEKINEITTDWTLEALKITYLILSESFLSAHKGMRVVLLSEIKSLNSGQFGKFLKALYSISNLELILFTNQISFEDDSIYCPYVQLSV